MQLEMVMDYKYGSHTVFNIQYYFEFFSQYRYQVLQGDIWVKVRESIRKTCNAFEIEILKGVASKDHLHLLVSAPPNMAPSERMWRVKRRSSSKFFESFPDFKERYWGCDFWARGYCCVKYGYVTEGMIKEYLAHHFEPKANDDFRTES